MSRLPYDWFDPCQRETRKLDISTSSAMRVRVDPEMKLRFFVSSRITTVATST